MIRFQINKQALWGILDQVTNASLGSAVMFMLVKVVSISDFGLYNFYVSVAGFVILLSNFGSSSYLTRRLSLVDSDPHYLLHIFLLSRFLFIFPLSVVVYIIYVSLSIDPFSFTSLLVLILTFFIHILTFLNATQYAQQNIQSSFLTNFYIKVFLILFLITCFHFDRIDLSLFILFYILLIFAFCVLILKKLGFIDHQYSREKSLWRFASFFPVILKSSYILLFCSLFEFFNLRIVFLLVSFAYSSDELGKYAFLFSLQMLFILPGLGIIKSYYPRIIREFSESGLAFSLLRIFVNLFIIFCSYSLVCYFFAIFILPKLLSWYNPGFALSMELISFYLVCALIILANRFINHVNAALGFERIWFLSLVFGSSTLLPTYLFFPNHFNFLDVHFLIIFLETVTFVVSLFGLLFCCYRLRIKVC